MDEKEDKHFCIVCNQTIHGLINYVIHRKNSCSDRAVSLDQSSSINSDDKETDGGKVEKKSNYSMEATVHDSPKDLRQFQDTESSVSQGTASSLSLSQFSETGILKNNHVDDDGSNQIQESVTSLNEEDRTSLQTLQLSEPNSIVVYFQEQSVDDNSDAETDLSTKPLEQDWNNVNSEIKEAILNAGKPIECSESVNEGMLNVADVDRVETELQVDQISPTPKKSGDYGLLSIRIAREKTEGSGNKYKGRKRKSQAFRLDGTQRRPIQSKRKGRTAAEQTEIGSVHLYGDQESVGNDDWEEIDENTGNHVDEGCHSDSYVEVKVETQIGQEINEECTEIGQKIETESEDLPNDILDSDENTAESKEGSGAEMDISSDSHQCCICDETFETKHKLVKHLLTRAHQTQAVGKQKEDDHFSLIKKHQRLIVHQSPFCCIICSFYFNDHTNLLDHLQSREHKKKVLNRRTLMCSLCNYLASKNKILLDHCQSKEHILKVEQKKEVCAIKIGRKKPKQLVCNICPANVTRRLNSRSHFLTNEHNRWKLAYERKNLTPGSGQEADSKTEIGVNGKEVKVEEESTSVPKSDTACGYKNEIKGAESTAVAKEDADTFPYIGIIVKTRELSTGSATEGDEVNDIADSGISDQIGTLKKPATCKYCTFETFDYHEMRPHYMKEHATMVKVCEVCNFVFPGGKGYKVHINGRDHQTNIQKFGNSVEGLFECHVCKKRFAEEGYCKFHTAYYHFHKHTEEEIMKEAENSVTMVKYGDYLSEIENVPNDHVLTCPECGLGIKKNNIQGHLRKHTGEKPFVCNICTEGFYSSSSLRRHLLSHFDCLEKTCEICGEHFKARTTYNVHMDIHKAKNTSSEKTNICHVCGEAFYVKRQLRMHMKNHATKDYKCEVVGCLWAFTNSHALKRHMLTHSSENPFICATCGYSTKSRKYLLSHEKIHCKDKFLKCPHCPYQTIVKTHLRRHMRIHLGTKPFKCPYCSYSCNTHDNIRKHILETTFHKGMKVYPCRLCNYATNCTKEFRTHILTDHTEINFEDVKGGSLAAFTGLFNKAEDVQIATGDMEILPCKQRKVSRRKIQSESEVDYRHVYE